MVAQKENTRGILSGFWIKIIATLLMLIDHVTASSFLYFIPYLYKRGFTLEKMENLRIFLRSIGRLSFPLFCFLIVEGFIHTKNIKKYLINMLIFAFISEIPFDMAVFGSYNEMKHQNVFFTLFLGLITLYFIKRYKGNPIFQIFLTLFISLISEVLGFDYGFYGILLIAILYAFRANKKLKYIFSGLIVTLSYFDGILMGAFNYHEGFLAGIRLYQWDVAFYYSIFSILSFVIMEMYNGKKGKNINKYIFYGFYPVHLLILGLIRTISPIK